MKCIFRPAKFVAQIDRLVDQASCFPEIVGWLACDESLSHVHSSTTRRVFDREFFRGAIVKAVRESISSIILDD